MSSLCVKSKITLTACVAKILRQIQLQLQGMLQNKPELSSAFHLLCLSYKGKDKESKQQYIVLCFNILCSKIILLNFAAQYGGGLSVRPPPFLVGT